jgi:hypothetical protein
VLRAVSLVIAFNTLTHRDDKRKNCWAFLGYLKPYWLVKNGCTAWSSYDSKDNFDMFSHINTFIKSGLLLERTV